MRSNNGTTAVVRGTES
jgi:hypothetical protein